MSSGDHDNNGQGGDDGGEPPKRADYSFMRTGLLESAPEPASQSDELDIEDLGTILGTLTVFLSKAMESADTYVQHAERGQITPGDVEYALKYQCFKFFDGKQHIELEIEAESRAAVEYLEAMDVDDSEEEEDADSWLDKDGDGVINDLDDESFSRSTCGCELCTEMNRITDGWWAWEPRNAVERSLKSAVDNAARRGGYF